MKLRHSTALTTTLLALLALLCLLPAAQAFHHPRLGRFVQRDPLEYGDGMALYQYLGDSPLDGTDWRAMEKSQPDNYLVWLNDAFLKIKQAFNTRQPNPNEVFEKRGNFTVTIKPCNVVILAGHTMGFYFTRTVVEGNSRVGFLTCFGDIFNKKINMHTFFTMNPTHPNDPKWEGWLNEKTGYYFYPVFRSTISDFPTIRGPIGDDGNTDRYNILWYIKGNSGHLIDVHDLTVGPKDKDGKITDFSSWNGGYGRGKKAFGMLIKQAKSAAMTQAKKLAEDCCNQCNYIDVWFIHVGRGGESTVDHQGIVDSYGCQKNSKTGRIENLDEKLRKKYARRRKQKLQRRYGPKE